jgi:hypothetical protein
VVWLDAHRGWQRTADDPGTRAVLTAVVKGRRARPVNVVVDRVATRQPAHRNVSTTAGHRRSDALQAVAS